MSVDANGVARFFDISFYDRVLVEGTEGIKGCKEKVVNVLKNKRVIASIISFS